MASNDAVLTGYRARLARLDQLLVGVYAERRALVAELMRYKVQTGLPLFDAAQEERVVARARAAAEARGLQPAEGERLMRWVLDRVHAESLAIGEEAPETGSPPSSTRLTQRTAPPRARTPHGR